MGPAGPPSIGLISLENVETEDTPHLYIPPRGVGGVWRIYGFKGKSLDLRKQDFFFGFKKEPRRGKFGDSAPQNHCFPYEKLHS